MTQCGWFSGSNLETKISHDNKLTNGKDTHVPGKEEIPKPQEAQAKVE